MTDTEKFEGFKKQALAENEARYGEEIRARYGEETVNATNAQFKNLRPDQYEKAETLRKELEGLLKALAPAADPACAEAQTLCDLHRQWLCCYWTPGMYTKAAHAALAQGHLADERFTAYYDAIVPGGMKFLAAALEVYTRA